ncbi:MAG TPA: SLC13 family permease [Anaerolineae bacterium]|nr:SLC13 family permease [Anaerolineae bacterium]HQK14077.1 SLC13 family permease [Anaerolineae bacterium]
MSLEIGLLLVIIVAAVVLFSLENLPVDVIALSIMMTLILTGLLPAEQAFAGFGSNTIVMIFGLLVLTAALVKTGITDRAGQELLRLAGDNPKRLLAIVMTIPAILSAFISNTATTAMFTPLTLGLARRTKTNPSKLLMPLAFATILASSVTLIASSTNIVVNDMIEHYGLKPLGLFEMTAVGLPIAVVGVVYMLTIGHRLIPNRGTDNEGSDTAWGLRPYLAEIIVQPGSPLIGKTLEESRLGRDLDLTVLRVMRGHNRYLVPQANLRLAEGDELLVKGQRDQILKIKDKAGIALKADVRLNDPRLQGGDTALVEVILLPNSPLTGRTLKTLNFRERYGLQVLGINRRGQAIFRKLSETRLRTGDQLLIQGPRTNIQALDEDNFHIIGTVEHQRPNRKRAPIALGIFAAVLLLSALTIVSLPVAVALGVIGVFVTRCITPDEAYREISWKAIIVIGCMLAMGRAMEYTGTAGYLANQIVRLTQGQTNPRWLLTAFFMLTMILTQPMSNQAAAVLVLPIAIQTALQLGLNPRTFSVMIAIGASCSFITPLEPACLIIYGPGGYKFIDFVKVGSLLTVLIYLVAIALVPLFWPF